MSPHARAAYRMLLLAGTAVVACSAPAERSDAGIDSALRAELLQLLAEDQQGRDSGALALAANDTGYIFRMMRADSARTRRLKAIIDEHGWPGPDKVDNDGVSAAFLLLQHSPDSAFQERLLPVLEREAQAGRMRPADVALLTDRVLVRSGKPQRYGSQFKMQVGKMIAEPIEDLDGLDARRAAVGLPPMAEYVKVLGEVYKQPVEWPPR